MQSNCTVKETWVSCTVIKLRKDLTAAPTSCCTKPERWRLWHNNWPSVCMLVWNSIKAISCRYMFMHIPRTLYPVYNATMLYATRYLQYASCFIHGKASGEQFIIQSLNPIPTAVTQGCMITKHNKNAYQPFFQGFFCAKSSLLKARWLQHMPQ